MKRLFRIFELSKNEQRVVLIVILVLITIAFVEYQRRVHHSPARAGISDRTETVSDCCGNDRRSVALLRCYARNSPVADKDRTDLGVAAFGWRRHFEIENADAPTLFAIVCAAVA